MSEYYNIIVFIVIGVTLYTVFMNRKRYGSMMNLKAGTFPQFGEISLNFLPYVFKGDNPDQIANALRWEAVRGWDINIQPTDLNANPFFNQVVLTDTLLNFCSNSNSTMGKSMLQFNFLLRMIRFVGFDEEAVKTVEGLPENMGLAKINTPSGETQMICSKDLYMLLVKYIKQAKIEAKKQNLEYAE